MYFHATVFILFDNPIAYLLSVGTPLSWFSCPLDMTLFILDVSLAFCHKNIPSSCEFLVLELGAAISLYCPSTN